MRRALRPFLEDSSTVLRPLVSTLGLGSRRGPIGRRLQAPISVPRESRIVLRAGSVNLEMVRRR